ncbi:hypothetical protein Rhopal_002625-T1 [Rhodotorula paludigena]|uniref:FAS1 domain-containing protein n=1 Tax=Rhodotorula paludigena TaxID=86838 RepID=A0AAV5GHM1_9BASI|nr:hypothetical protein Rhopal_002625-T1 [Rhodotorula paludigena]
MRWTRLLWLPVAAALAHKPSHPPPPDTSTLVDLLSASDDHQLLLAAFQRARLIPTLNRLNGSTLFAPTDKAIRDARDRDRSGVSAGGEDHIWSAVVEWVDEGRTVAEDSRDEEHDNLQLALRDTLLYHVLNYTLLDNPAVNHTNSSEPVPKPLPLDLPVLHETLYFPSLFPYNRSFPAPPSLPGTEPDRPDPDAPKDRPEGLLHGEGQRVRILRKKDDKDDEVWIGVDWKGEGGIKTAQKARFARNGVLLPVDAVLDKPKDLATIIRTTSELSMLASLLPTPVLDYLSTAPHLTLFAPTNDAWAALTELEMRYLRSGLAELDLSEIFGDGTSQSGAGKGKVGYLDRLVGLKGRDKTSVTSLRNGTIEVAGQGERTAVQVNGTDVVTGDVLAKNGVIHTLPSLLLPSGSLALTAEKYLIALDATHFVTLLRSVNLSHYVQVPSNEPGTVIDTPLPPPLSDPSQFPLPGGLASAQDTNDRERYTILAVKDDVLAASIAPLGAGAVLQSSLGSPILNGHRLPPAGSDALRELLSYHIVSGQWVPSNLEDDMLLGTELRTNTLRGARQRIRVGVQGEEGGRGDGWEKSKKGKKGKGGGGGGDDENELLSWGGANVVADPVVVGDSIIYLLSSLVEPPPTAITAAVSDLRLSTFVAAVYAAALDGTLATQPAVSYLVPTNNAFGALGLTMQYLLLPSSRPELRSVLKYHAVDEVVYSDDFPRSGGARYPTLLDGAEIYFEHDPVNSTLSVHGPTLGGLPANGESRDAAVVEGDILTETGVLHVLDQVELPPELDITLEKLLRGAKANTMIDLIRAANMTWVLRGEHPPSDDEAAALRKVHQRKGSRTGDDDLAYTILCPSDKDFSRLNLTYYHSNPAALSALVRLHVIPTTESSSSGSPFPPRTAEPGSPLVLEDTKSYATLLDKGQPGGSSAYGTVAFRKWGAGEDAWMVGIQGARGTKGESDAARVVAWGRATPFFVDDDGDGSGGDGGDALSTLSTRLAAAGGVISIDSVLLPYEPGWFRRWGWIVLVSLLGAGVLVLAGLFALRTYRRRRQARYERLLQEDDDE